MSLIFLSYYFRSILKRSRRLSRAVFCGLTVAISDDSRSCCSIISLSRSSETASPSAGLSLLSIFISTCGLEASSFLARYLARDAFAAFRRSSGNWTETRRWWRCLSASRFCIRFGWCSEIRLNSWKVVSYDIQEISANLIARKYLDY